MGEGEDTAERAFAGLAIVLLLATTIAAAGPVRAGAERPTTGTDRIAFEPPVPSEYAFSPPRQPGRAVVDNHTYASVEAALAAADPGDTIRLTGRFQGPVVVNTTGVTLVGPRGGFALINGTAEGDVLTIAAPNVTIRRVWVRNSGFDPAENDAGIWIDAPGARIVDSRVTAITFGVWVNGVDRVRVVNNTIVGRESVTPLSYRGNGIQLWKTEHTVVSANRITDVRDGIYYSWASDVLARRNTMWDLRYGVHYMYSDDCALVNNTAFNNDVGYALMVSQDLRILDNTAVNNTGRSGHGILVKSIDHTVIRNNTLVANEKGLYVYNSLDNTIAGNLVLANRVGVHLTAGSVRERVYANSFIDNRQPVHAVIEQQVAWNTTRRGNYWSSARVADLDGDGISEIRYRPAGMVEFIVRRTPRATVFAGSPAFDTVRLAESSIPVVEAPGVIDYHPLTTPPHDAWRRYYERDQRA